MKAKRQNETVSSVRFLCSSLAFSAAQDQMHRPLISWIQTRCQDFHWSNFWKYEKFLCYPVFQYMSSQTIRSISGPKNHSFFVHWLLSSNIDRHTCPDHERRISTSNFLVCSKLNTCYTPSIASSYPKIIQTRWSSFKPKKCGSSWKPHQKSIFVTCHSSIKYRENHFQSSQTLIG